MKKFVCMGMAALLLALCLVGCGGSSKSNDTPTATPAPAQTEPAAEGNQPEEQGMDLAAAVAAIEEANPIANPRDIDDFSIANDFGFAEGLVADYCGKISNDQGDSGMILALKAAEGKGAELKTACDTYKADQEAFFGNYYEEFAEGMALIADGRVVQKGDYVFVVFASLSVGGYDAIDGALSAIA